MHILLIGDVVGNSGCCFLQERLPQLKRTHQVDLTIVNGENSAQGNGITKHSMEQLFSAGADIITTGNHCFQRREALSIYEKETVLRPLNTSSTTAAIRGRARCCRHHSRLWAYFSCTFSNQARRLGSAFFSTVEDAAGTTVSATMREAIRQ